MYLIISEMFSDQLHIIILSEDTNSLKRVRGEDISNQISGHLATVSSKFPV